MKSVPPKRIGEHAWSLPLRQVERSRCRRSGARRACRRASRRATAARCSTPSADLVGRDQAVEHPGARVRIPRPSPPACRAARAPRHRARASSARSRSGPSAPPGPRSRRRTAGRGSCPGSAADGRGPGRQTMTVRSLPTSSGRQRSASRLALCWFENLPRAPRPGDRAGRSVRAWEIPVIGRSSQLTVEAEHGQDQDDRPDEAQPAVIGYPRDGEAAHDDREGRVEQVERCRSPTGTR